MSMIKFLKGLKQEIVLIGHDNIDCDSAISALLFRRFLEYFDIRSRVVILDENIHDTDIRIMKQFAVNLNYFKGTIKNGEPIFLLDHYKTSHGENVVGCIDHHPNQQNISYPIYINKKSSSTGKLIYDLMLNYNYPITKTEIELIVLSIMVDTSSLKSTKCPPEHKTWVKKIIKEYNLDYDKFYSLGLCLSDLKKPLSEIVSEGLKKYTFNNTNITSSYIQINEEIDVVKLTNYIQTELLNKDMPLWIFLIHDFRNDSTKEYRISKTKVEEITYPQITSRGTDVMPYIEKNIDEIKKKMEL